MIDPAVVSAVGDLAAQVTAAQPLDSASPLAIAAIQQLGASVLAQLDAAMAPAGGDLDADDPVIFSGSLPAYLIGLRDASRDQSALADMRSLVGRAMFNLAQASAS